jgi:hypothetical protein
MITVRPGSHIHRLLQLLSAAGEIPASALSILGSERVLAALVHRLESVRDIRFGKGGPVHRVRLLRVSGKRNTRTVRLYRKALPLLDGLHPGLRDWYMGATGGHSFTGDPFRIRRNHRVAEVLALCMAAGAEIRPYALPPLQKTEIARVVPDSPCFYIARDFKKAGDEANKTMYTRIVGALFFPGGVYAAYNTRDAVMKWSGRGEIKTLGNLLELARMNAGLDDVSAALLFGQSAEVALNTVLESDRSRRAELRFDRIYTRIHFVPLNRDGVRLLRLLVLPNRNEKLLGALFDSNQRSYNRGHMEYDAAVDGKKILSHLDGDIARLIRFREALAARTEPAEVLCFPWQTGFLRAYLGGLAGLRELEPGAVETALRE